MTPAVLAIAATGICMNTHKACGGQAAMAGATDPASVDQADREELAKAGVV
jgi:hypothetical protein